MRLITTHLGADFDALGAAVGATLFDPTARVVFPGSQEAAVRRFLQAENIHFNEVRIRELRRARIDSAIVVDCASERRLGEVGELIRASGCPVQVIDHHPEGANCLPGARLLTAPVAATCTVVTGELERRGLEPDALTASMLLLGIYEDTGGLTYADTTPRDASAVAWLLDRGARLEWVRRYVLRPLEPEQLDLLNQLVEGAIEHRVGGLRVVISVARPSEQLEEAAFVVHRYAEIFDLPVAIALLEVPPQLIVIARSTDSRLDAGKLLSPYGGGGHATAAACRLRGQSAVELAERLLADVRCAVGSAWTASSVASPYVHTCSARTTAAAAKERLVRLRINAMPVEKNGELVGMVTRQILDNAIAQGLGHRPVTTVMAPGVAAVPGDAPVEEVERLFMEGAKRLVIVERPEGRGVITRMDLFRRLYQRQLSEGEVIDRRVAGARPVVHGEAARLRKALSPELLGVLETAGEIAGTAGMRAYLVGGAVRDILLGRAIEDVDIVVEGNGLELSARLVERFGGGYHPHEPFLTAAVLLANGVRLDVATARTEFYRSPAALPEVETSAMRQDLYRRDFTINAMAIKLSPEGFGELVDYFGGRRDLDAGQIRVLHSLSFLDDPTRVIRAVRFGTRLGFDVAAETRQLIRVAVREGVFASLTGERLRDELFMLFDEDNPADALQALERLGALHAVFPRLRWSEGVRRLLHSVEAMVAWSELERILAAPRWLVFFAAIATRMPESAGAAFAENMALSGEKAGIVARARQGCERLLAASSRKRALPSEIVAALERSQPVWWVVAMAQAAETERRLLHKALTVWLRVPPPVTGKELIRAGVPAGPALGEALRRTRTAVLDGAVERRDALEYAVSVADELLAEP